jgi:hypothetical protein
MLLVKRPVAKLSDEEVAADTATTTAAAADISVDVVEWYLP